MGSIRDQLLDFFEKYSDDDARLIEELQGLIEKEGKDIYSFIFQILTNLDLSPDEAEKHWQEIIANCKDFSAALGRKINLRTAVCDYFCSMER